MEHFGLDVPIDGKPMIEFIMELIEKNERQATDLQRTRTTVQLLKTGISRSRLEFQVARYERELNNTIIENAASSAKRDAAGRAEPLVIKPEKDSRAKDVNTPFFRRNRR